MEFLKANFNKTKLANGCTIITEHYSHMHAVALGFAVRAGSSNEKSMQLGITHFLEHLVFKGTKKYNAFDLVNLIESKGGDINAFTSREMTCFHTMSLRQDIGICVDVLMELVSKAKLSKEEIVKERDVILQEIAMTTDSPEEYIYDLFFENIYEKTKLGKSILGSKESLFGISQKDVKDFYKATYGPKNLVICAVGNIDHKDLVRRVKSYRLMDCKKLVVRKKRIYPKNRLQFTGRDSEQCHILLSLPAHSLNEGRFYEATVINAYLGGGMTSKLYQKLREKQGLCYSVYSGYYPFENSGCFAIYIGLDPQNSLKAIRSIKKEVELLRKKKISRALVSRIKEQIKASLLLNYDDIDSRMNQLIVDEFAHRKFCSIEEHLEKLDMVNPDSIWNYANTYFTENSFGISMLGEISQKIQEKISNELGG